MNNREIFEKKKKIIPGGVNSPVRAFLSVGGNPIIIEKGEGAFIYDIEGSQYLDFLSSWGPMILGHGDESVKKSLENQLSKGIGYGTPTYVEFEMAKLIVDNIPSVEMVRMVNSGTEATMTAIRLARAYTQKEKIIKVHGGYHGHADPFLVSAGSGLATLGIPASPGVTSGTVKDTLTVPYNNIDALDEIIEKNKNEIAAFILEPIPGNMGVILPKDSYLKNVRKLTKEKGILLIFDEVITGFRLSPSGAQGLYEIEPDLTTLGKIIGGGLPVGALGGKKEVMEMLSPSGKVYQAGTLSGNPLAMSAGKAVLEKITNGKFYKNLNQKSDRFFNELRETVKDMPIQINAVGSMGTIFFNENPVYDYNTASASNSKKYAQFFHGMLNKGIYMAPSSYECIFISSAQTESMLDEAIHKMKETLKEIGY